MTTIRVIKTRFTPDIGEAFAGNDDPLIVHIYGCMRNGQFVHLELEDTVPRFWVKSDIDPKEAVGRHSRFILDTAYDESRSLAQEPVWTIYVKHPANIYTLRKHFEETFQDNIFYDDAVRALYQIPAFIDVPYECIIGEERFTPDKIKPSDKEFRMARDFMFDIETSDSGGFPDLENPDKPVRCLTLQDMKTGQHYVLSTTDANHSKLAKMMSSSEFLKKYCNLEDEFDEDIEPIQKDKILLKCFDYEMVRDEDFYEEEAERWLFREFYNLLSQVKPNRILGHNVWDFDINYMIKRAEKMNRDIDKWNKDNMGVHLPKEPFISPKELFDTIQVFDTMHGYSSMIQGSTEARGRAALDWMCRRELGYGKINRFPRTIDEMHENDPDFLLAYNIWDCEVATRAVETTDMLEFYASLCDYNQTGLNNLGSPKKMIISNMTYRLKTKEVLPTLKRMNTGIEGGFVADAPTIIERKMFELDLAKEYPAVIITGNICFKTHVKDLRLLCDTDYDEPIENLNEWKEKVGTPFEPKEKVVITPRGNCYKWEIPGVVPKILTEMGDDRNRLRAEMKKATPYSQEWKILNNQQIARKVSMNSWYGVLAQVYPTIGADITDIARRNIKWIRDKCGIATMLYNPDTKKGAVGFSDVDGREGFMKLQFEVVYTDTDSAKCRISNRREQEELFDYQLQESDIMKIGAILSEKLNKSFADFAELVTGGITKEHAFSVKVEEAYAAYMQAGAKKRYAYLKFDGKVETRGFDTRRSDSTELTKKALNKMFYYILNNPDDNEGVLLFANWLAEFEKEIKNGDYDKYCGKPIGLNSANERTQHYKAAMASNRILGKDFKVGDKVYLWWVKPQPDKEDVGIFALEFDESPYVHGLEPNYDEIIQKFVRRKIDLILEPLIGKKIKTVLESEVKIHNNQETAADLF